jgi:enamine deaminase RidA (YjgF/YER057c/UK114 family)
MSQIVIHNGTVFLSGQVPLSDTGPSVLEQTRQVLGKIDKLLLAAKSDKSRVLSATIWLTDMADFAEMNKAWEEWVPAGHTPARATVESPRLAAPQYKVEIGVIAAES